MKRELCTSTVPGFKYQYCPLYLYDGARFSPPHFTLLPPHSRMGTLLITVSSIFVPDCLEINDNMKRIQMKKKMLAVLLMGLTLYACRQTPPGTGNGRLPHADRETRRPHAEIGIHCPPARPAGGGGTSASERTYHAHLYRRGRESTPGAGAVRY